MKLSLTNFSNFLIPLLKFSSQDKILIALSGGVDSVVLTDLCLKVLGRDRVRIANFNHKLRSEEEQKLERNLLEYLSSLWKIDFFWGETKEDLLSLSKRKRESLEAVARESRYKYLKELQEQENIKYLATAHHKDDQLETFFMSLLSKGSFSSLKGIRPQREGGLIRPLLNFTRAEIELYQKENFLPYWQDSTNALDIYTRNKVRLQILPLIYNLFPHSLDSFSDWQKRFSDLYDWVEEILPLWEKSINNSIRIKTKDFLNLPDFLQGELLLKGFYFLKETFFLEGYKIRASFIEELINKIQTLRSLKKTRDILSSAHWKVTFDNLFIILEPIIVKKSEISYFLRVNSNQWYSLPCGDLELSFYLDKPLYLASYDYRWKFSHKDHSKSKKFFSFYKSLNNSELVLLISEGEIIALWSKERMDFLWKGDLFSSIEIIVDKGAI